MNPPEKAEGPVASRTPGTATTTSHKITDDPDSVDQALAEIRRWERASRLVADDPALTIKAKCKALMEMSFRSRRSDLRAFLETAIWKGCRHLFEKDGGVPTDTIGAIRRLRRAGHTDCPSCRRPLPNHDVLDYWRELTHDYRRPA